MCVCVTLTRRQRAYRDDAYVLRKTDASPSNVRVGLSVAGQTGDPWSRSRYRLPPLGGATLRFSQPSSSTALPSLSLEPHPNLAMAIRYSLCRKFSSNLLVRMLESLRAPVKFKSLSNGDRRSYVNLKQLEASADALPSKVSSLFSTRDVIFSFSLSIFFFFQRNYYCCNRICRSFRIITKSCR